MAQQKDLTFFTRCQSRCRLFLRVIISLVAVALCAYQLYIVSMLYFKYPTTVDIRLDPSPTVHLPGVTVCSELSSTILVEELVKIQPALYKVMFVIVFFQTNFLFVSKRRSLQAKHEQKYLFS